MSADTLRRGGRNAYEDGDYAKALGLFRRAVKQQGDPSAPLLDHLAATHEKLKDLDAALQAAKKTIQTWPVDPTGYLRAGRVLVKMGKKSTALDIYNHALKKVKPVGLAYEKLKKAQAEVLKEVAPQKSVDPLTVLPREMALVVLEYLSFRQRLAISRVSKGWRDFIRSEPTLWTHLDLTGARAKVSNKLVSTVINTAKHKLTAATLNKLWDFDKVLTALASRPTLQSLTLLETGLQGQNLVDSLQNAKGLKELKIMRGTEVSQTTLQSLALQHCRKLEVLQCALIKVINFGSRWDLQLPALQTLDITAGCMSGVSALCAKLGEHSPHLRSLTLRELEPTPTLAGRLDLSQCHKIEDIRLRLAYTQPQQLRLPRSVRTLDLTSSCGRASAGSTFFSVMEHGDNEHGLKWSRLPHLRDVKLDFPGARFSDITSPFHITHHEGKEIPDISKLKSLSLVNPSISSDTRFNHEERLSDLEHWAITGCLDLKDDHVERMLRSYKKLRSLDFSGSSITGVAIKEIVKGGHVRELIANDCLQVGRDAIDWARSQGLKVQFGNTSSQVTGKKVRY